MIVISFKRHVYVVATGLVTYTIITDGYAFLFNYTTVCLISDSMTASSVCWCLVLVFHRAHRESAGGNFNSSCCLCAVYAMSALCFIAVFWPDLNFFSALLHWVKKANIFYVFEPHLNRMNINFRVSNAYKLPVGFAADRSNAAPLMLFISYGSVACCYGVSSL